MLGGGESGVSDILLSCTPESLQMVMAPIKLGDACSLEGKL